MTEIIKRIKQFIVEEIIAENTNGDFGEEQSLLENGIIDSLGIMKLLDYFEEEFEINIDGDEILPENFENLLAISKLVQSKTGPDMVN